MASGTRPRLQRRASHPRGRARARGLRIPRAVKLPRHLTREAKRRELERWARLRTEHIDAPGVPDPSQPGHADPDVYPLCDRLNALTGVCTIQSCAGHALDDGWLRTGHLWLWLDAATAEKFDRQAWALATAPSIERVARLYLPSGQEISCIEFAGNERGLLKDSSDTIATFFASLAS